MNENSRNRGSTAVSWLETEPMTALLLANRPLEVRGRYVEFLRKAFPDVVVTDAGARAPREQLAEAQVLITEPTSVNEDLLREAPALRWVHMLTSGTDGVEGLRSLPPEAVLTNTRGIHAAAMSEAALMAILALSRDLPRAIRNQALHVWERWPSALLEGKTVGILGLGAIGRALAVKCSALGMRVAGISRTKRAVASVDAVYGWSEIREVVTRFDFVVSLLPSNADTRGVIDRELLAAMKRTAYLVNLGRGDTIDEVALVEALRTRRIAGAALDVFSEEPLPLAHPFWELDNVLVTPHLGGAFDGYVERALPIIETNMRAFLRGDLSSMVNVVCRRSDLAP